MKIISDSNKEFNLSVGDEIFVSCKGRGGHGAWIEIEKINRKTFECVEREGSYNPGTKWKVHVGSTFAIVERGPNIRGWQNIG